MAKKKAAHKATPSAKKTPAPAKKVAKKATSSKKPIEPKTVVAEIVDENEGPVAEVADDQAYSSAPEIIVDEPTPAATGSLVPAASKSITSTDPLVLYLNEIRKYNVLSKEDEHKIALRYFETHKPEDAQALVQANLRFVVKVAAEYSRFGAKMIDLIQEGNVGLMHAVREFNPHKGARLITYAVWWIRGYIQEYLMRQYSMVRIGTTQNQRKLFYQLQKEKEKLDSMGIEPNVALISSRLGIPEDEVKDMSMRMSGRDLSLDRPIDDDSGASLGDMQKNDADVPLDEQIGRAEQLDILRQRLEEIRPDLSEREKIILDERILNDEPLTLQEIGEKYGITREAVRQMENRLMKKIRTKMESVE